MNKTVIILIVVIVCSCCISIFSSIFGGGGAFWWSKSAEEEKKETTTSVPKKTTKPPSTTRVPQKTTESPLTTPSVLPDLYRHILVRSNQLQKCITVPGDGKTSIGADCTYTDWQLWDVLKKDDNNVFLRNKHFQKCLTSNQQYNVATLQDCDASNDEMVWNIESNGDGVRIKNKKNSCLTSDVDGVVGNLSIATCSNNNNQKFQITPTGNWGYWYKHLEFRGKDQV